MIASLPFAANSGHTLATVASGSSRPRSISELTQTDVTPFVDEYTSTIVSSLPRRAVRRVGDAAPQVDDRLPVDVHAHRRADLAAFVEVLRERVEHRFEFGRDPAVDHRSRTLGP